MSLPLPLLPLLPVYLTAVPAGFEQVSLSFYIPQPAAPLPFFLSFGITGAFADQLTSEWDGNYVLFDTPIPIRISLPINLVGSPQPICAIAPAANTAFTLQWITASGVLTPIVTVNYLAGQTKGSYASSSVWVIQPNDRLRLIAPPTVDSSIVEPSGTIVANRV